MSDPEGTPTTLLCRANDGDPEAFGEFFDGHATQLLRYFQLRTAEAEVAADLCSETFASALESLDGFDPNLGSPRQWLYGIARHKFSHWLHQERVDRRARERIGLTTATEHVDDLDLIELRADLAAMVGRLDAAMMQLSDGVRDAVTLRIVGMHPYRIVAQRLGCSEVAARVRVSHGLDALLGQIGLEATP